jgi:hypothetical protein
VEPRQLVFQALMSPQSHETPFNLSLPGADLSAATQSGRVLEPMDRIIEVLCGLIMVLTFTLATPLSGRSDVRSMLVAALGCNLAWGIVDATVYLMMQLTERRSGLRALKALRKVTDPAAAHRIVRDALPPVLAAVLYPADVEAIRRRLDRLPEPDGPHLSKKAWRGALGVFLLVFLSTLPVVVPFAFIGDVQVARRCSNLIAVGMLFITGYAFGRVAGYHPVLVGLTMVVFGSALVLTTIALGG